MKSQSFGDSVREDWPGVVDFVCVVRIKSINHSNLIHQTSQLVVSRDGESTARGVLVQSDQRGRRITGIFQFLENVAISQRTQPSHLLPFLANFFVKRVVKEALALLCLALSGGGRGINNRSCN